MCLWRPKATPRPSTLFRSAQSRDPICPCSALRARMNPKLFLCSLASLAQGKSKKSQYLLSPELPGFRAKCVLCFFLPKRYSTHPVVLSWLHTRSVLYGLNAFDWCLSLPRPNCTKTDIMISNTDSDVSRKVCLFLLMKDLWLRRTSRLIR